PTGQRSCSRNACTPWRTHVGLALEQRCERGGFSMAGADKKVEFGFSVFPYSYVSFAEMVELAKLGDQLGYYAMMLPEHLLTPHWPQAPISTKYWYDVMVVGGALAAVTSKVKLMTGVSVVPYHPPVQMAKS